MIDGWLVEFNLRGANTRKMRSLRQIIGRAVRQMKTDFDQKKSPETFGDIMPSRCARPAG